MNECWINKPPFYQCCCQCENHIEDKHHPSTTDKSMSEHKGWICLWPFHEEPKRIAFSGWPEHSCGCELFIKRS